VCLLRERLWQQCDLAPLTRLQLERYEMLCWPEALECIEECSRDTVPFHDVSEVMHDVPNEAK
jgi:hypothetical protein